MTPEQLVESHLDLPTITVAAFCKGRPSMRRHYDDLMSYAMEALWESAQRYQANDASFSTYAIHRIRWACVDTARRIYGRRGRPRRNMPMLFTDFYVNDPLRRKAEYTFLAVDGVDRHPSVGLTESQWADLTRCLSPHFRRVIEMRFRLEKSYEWIARELGINVKTAMSIVSQSMKRMRRFAAEVAA